ncbi:variable large family protein [Borrelia crocidurae]|uniref:Variable large protein n=1 Tax=Borrelia crocidurae (strain Achema) TaxID=1155096 RepID=I0FEL9_BORCA|nr:variable large family protein [Borrelia crocidurae]AFI31925.1 Vlp protein, delta subfamily [Borrelia crocidurae str. Achema]
MKIEKKAEGKGRVVILMVMVVMIVMGCNSGGVKDPEKVFLSEMVNLGKGFLEVFVSFGDMITETLGIKADTKKSEIGAYFTKIENTMKIVKEKLWEILEKNGNYTKVKEKVEEFIGKISKIEEGAKEVTKGATGEDKIGGAPTTGQDPAPADFASVNLLVKGIKTIVGVVLKANEGNPEASKTGDTEKKSIGKLLSKKDDGTEAHSAAASASIGAVTGDDILQAIAKSGEAANNDVGIDQAKNAAEIASAKKADNKEFGIESAKKDAVIAAGIALRGMGKGGKFAANNDAKDANAVNGAVVSAVNKVLSTLVIGIRNRVDEGLKEINKVLGEIKQREGSVVKINE